MCAKRHFLKRNLCAFQVSCVRSSHDLCAHAHSLEGTLLPTTKECVNVVPHVLPVAVFALYATQPSGIYMQIR